MKILSVFMLSLLLALNSYCQNNAPIAVNDTIWVTFNDSVFIQQTSFGISYPPFMDNDTDLDGDAIYIDTAFYNGLGNFNDTLIVIISTQILRINYKPPLNYVGIDSIQYVIRDDGIPIMYDTATIYIFVKNKEFEQLDLNNINATIAFDGLFTDKRMTNATNNLSSGFEVPKGNNTHTISGAYLWIGGKNQDSVFTNARNNYSFSETWGNSGPIMDSIYYNYNYSYKWDRVWKITSNEINYHINNWNTSGYQPIDVIKNWPAHGDTTKGEAFYLAPFVDNNGDGIYNPYDGDYPKIKGQQAIYFIYNDMRTKYSNRPMQTEVHGMAYAYNCPADSAINNTIFLDYTIYNRSNLTFDSTYIGFVANLNIGSTKWSSYIGSDVDRSSYYVYNADSINQPDTTNIYDSYGTHPPAQGVVFLRGAKQDNDGINNAFGINPNESVNGFGFGDGIVDNEYWGMEHFISYYNGTCFCSSYLYPIFPIDYYNYLNGIWKDGAHMVYGMNGHPASGGTVPTKFQYPNNSDSLWYGTRGLPQTPWSEMNAANGYPNTPSNKNGIGSTGPFTFYPDSSISITLAFVFGRDYQTTGNQAGIVVMQERIDSIRSYYLTDFVSVCGGALSVEENTQKENALLIYPNPFNNELTINYALKHNAATLTIYNLVGEQVKTQTITKNSTKINLGNLVAGIYFISITDGTNRVNRKIIKQ